MHLLWKMYFKMLKNWTKNSRYTSKQFMFTHKFLRWKDIFCDMCKKTKNGHISSNVGALKLVFFTKATKNVLFSRNFMREHIKEISHFLLPPRPRWCHAILWGGSMVFSWSLALKCVRPSCNWGNRIWEFQSTKRRIQNACQWLEA
jgi:hypothetical protein